MKITSRRGAQDSTGHVPKGGNVNRKRRDMIALLGIRELRVKQQGVVFTHSQGDTQELIEPSPGKQQRTLTTYCHGPVGRHLELSIKSYKNHSSGQIILVGNFSQV